MSYSIRLAVKTDEKQIGQLYEKAFSHSEGFIDYFPGFGDYLDFFICQDNAFVYEKDDIIYGAALVYETPSMDTGRTLYIDFLAVLPDHQNQGIGKTLLSYVYEVAKKRNIKEVSLRTPCYRDSYLIYRHLGFRDAQESCQYLFMKLKEE